MNSTDNKRQAAGKRIGIALWCLLLVLLLATHWYPIRFRMLRLLMVAGVLLLWSGALWLVWSHKVMRRILIMVSALLLVFILWPSRPSNPQLMRQEYVQALKRYEGTKYVWGGEGKRGIDCSGLMRCGFIDANIKQGFSTFNPSLLREGFSLWWNDCSAKALKEEYQQRTRLLLTAPL